MEERRLWLTVYGLLALAGVLVLASFTNPWFQAAVERDDSTFEASFYPDTYRLTLFLHEDEDPANPKYDYRSNMEVKTVMAVTWWLVLLGLLGILAFLAGLVLYQKGILTSAKPLYAAWVVLVLCLGLGLLFFTLTIANATENDIREIAADSGVSIDPEVNVVFWDGDGEPVGFGNLVSNPGASWFLTLQGLANVLAATVVLFRFPAAEPTSPA